MATAVKPDIPPLQQFDPISEPSFISQRWKKDWTILTVCGSKEGQRLQAKTGSFVSGNTRYFRDGNRKGDNYTTAKKVGWLFQFSLKKNVYYEIFQVSSSCSAKGRNSWPVCYLAIKVISHIWVSWSRKELNSAIIQSCQLRRYALREEALTLDALLTNYKACSLEASERQTTGMECNLLDELVHNIQNQNSKGTESKITIKCWKCGLMWPRKSPAKWQTCHKCGKPNH